ncbi:thioredoxin reductase [Ordospora colligata]|uniref:Thioredoxin reductase n=1 Tax=Ordospora colligata OC4 TaxID=1354746 RepID=A0A0B2ULS7_9MICR|nr:thioredoxin reductase [Ordospora colligata OC4]KHN70253.1 thioredoxin reductase [Ordospora colligata OC4]TBU16797.1 thioredoxin reductase [Ordospora colligata]TBU16905.1 thioredoxin reductase [Ordospora colligata]TBU19346.1 thioredoxin reductase [Ordospora colligata]
MEDIIIIGSGPAAYSAALYTMDRKPVLYEGRLVGNNGPGGQLTTTTAVDNYPGFPDGTNGPRMMELMKEQALSRGLRIVEETVSEIRRIGDEFIVVSEFGEERLTRSVIVATGASARRLFVTGTGDDEFWQRGVSSCAVCDGFAYVNKVVCVIGGGDAAMEEALYLASIAKKVYVIHRRNEFRARWDMVEKARKAKNVEFLIPYVLERVSGTSVVERIHIRNTQTGEENSMEMDGVFFGIGHDPNTGFLSGSGVELEEDGYIATRDGVFTSVKGIFAAGDVCDKKYRQAVTAACSGAESGIRVNEYLDME